MSPSAESKLTTDYELRLPGMNGRVRIERGTCCEWVHLIVDDMGNRAEVFLTPAEARQIAAVLQTAAEDSNG
jgi:hypothetical protein